MHFKFGLICLVNFMFAISYTNSAAAYCSLERMKKFAIEACEHLFIQEDAREKRSIDNRHNILYNNGFAPVYKKKHLIARSIYPHGGYLKVNGEHFHRLSKIDVVPKYKKSHMDKHERFKRAHFVAQRFDDERYDNISYCCYNKCEEDFFC